MGYAIEINNKLVFADKMGQLLNVIKSETCGKRNVPVKIYMDYQDEMIKILQTEFSGDTPDEIMFEEIVIAKTDLLVPNNKNTEFFSENLNDYR